jgi:RNA polymerase sigma-70 factor (ECF subfamily)
MKPMGADSVSQVDQADRAFGQIGRDIQAGAHSQTFYDDQLDRSAERGRSSEPQPLTPSVPVGAAYDEVFAEMFKAQYPRIWAYLRRRLTDQELANDITAEVFRLAWEQTQKGGPPDPPWLFVTARNLLSNAYRSEARAAQAGSAMATEMTRDPNRPPQSESQSNADDLQERVREALWALPGGQREILIAHYWDGFSGADCAALLGCSIPAAWMRLTRARAAFKTRFTELKD